MTRKRRAAEAKWNAQAETYRSQLWKVWIGPKDQMGSRFWTVDGPSHNITTASEAIAYVEQRMLDEVKDKMRLQSVTVEGPRV